MLTKSFIFLDKVGPKKEQILWNKGYHTWKTFVETRNVQGFTPDKKYIADRTLQLAQQALHAEDPTFFKTLLASSQMWRAYDYFSHKTVFLDIETTYHYGDITVIGLHDGTNTYMFVKGKNLDKQLFLDVMRQYDMIVTFNGASFDIPVIEKYFNIKLSHLHVDLRHVCSKIGLTGGLKNIEKEIGLARDHDVTTMSGADAVVLWEKYRKTGNDHYLELLLKYNEEDIVNLVPLARYAIPRLWQSTFNGQKL